MDSTAHYRPQTITFDSMASPDSQFLKLEDLHTSSSPSFEDPSDDSTPSTVFVVSRPAKKRKSWGQQLPEPTTNLPPRKRAKTEDEKEQRRIERIKRNRAAAHNSRERKRQETDDLAVKLARANAELEAYRKLHGPLPASVVLPQVVVTEVSDGSATPAPSLVESRGSIDATASLASPDMTDSLFGDDTVMIKEEPDLTYPPLPNAPMFDLTSLAGKPSPALSLLDPTQHSAVMLCDLQCRSTQRSSSSNPPHGSSNRLPPSWWTALFLHLTRLSLQTTYTTFLLAAWSHSPSRMARLTRASAARSTSPSTTSSTRTTPPLRLSRVSTAAALAQRNAATRPPVARQGALALQQRSAVLDGRAQRMRDGRGVAVRCQTHQRGQVNVEAFEEHGRDGGVETTDDDRGGVGR